MIIVVQIMDIINVLYYGIYNVFKLKAVKLFTNMELIKKL